MRKFRVQVTLQHVFEVEAKDEEGAEFEAVRSFNGTTPEILAEVLDEVESEDGEFDDPDIDAAYEQAQRNAEDEANAS